jgi:2',3'-cyclic-nucleotide 2'-phosphodiesterase (5'-nucleotidase family)
VRVAEPGAPKSRLLAVELAGDSGSAAIDPAARYRVATNSVLAGGGDGYFDAGVKIAVDTGLLMRDLLEDALRAAGAAGLAAAADERFLGGA